MRHGGRNAVPTTFTIVSAALSGALDKVADEKDQVFNLDVPTSCPGVPADVLNPRSTWADPAAYDAQAAKLARMFADNFKRFEDDVTGAVKAAGPRVG